MAALGGGCPTHALELVADVQLVGVEEQEDEVAARRKPLADLHKVVGALDALLLTRQHAWGGRGGGGSAARVAACDGARVEGQSLGG